MRLLEIILTKYIFGFTLQSFLLVLGMYTFNRVKFDSKSYFKTGLLVTFMSTIMKMLPISVGVQTIMNMLFLYLICVIYLKMNPYLTIRSTSLCVVLILLSEMIITAITVLLIGQNGFQVIIQDSVKRNYIGCFANIVFALIILTIHFVLKRKGEKNRIISR